MTLKSRSSLLERLFTFINTILNPNQSGFLEITLKSYLQPVALESCVEEMLTEFLWKLVPLTHPPP